MADGALDKIKEQCLELVLNIIPMSQLGFVFVTAVVAQRLKDGHGKSTFDALGGLGLKNMFGLSDGMFWSVNVLAIGACFFLALVNAYFLKKILRRSFDSSRISTKLDHWLKAALEAVKGLDKDDRAPIRESIKGELERRLKKYQAKRLLSEVLFSICVFLGYTSIYVFVLCGCDFSKITVSWAEIVVGVLSALCCFLSHRNSVSYALAKVVPLQVYLSAATGEISFFIDAD
ncbi:TPA: hypothetical protein QDC03_007197 [Burkholderia cepacia]|uniref:hypothetical protein n=1 Tax=Burkholderia cepacia TaxID=292 RepID=UPI0011B24FF9|nr:hypothetical protein [Burkholderia cepacia]HDR9511959.1 hypothetical protein [Burkholderia cepacia]